MRQFKLNTAELRLIQAALLALRLQTGGPIIKEIRTLELNLFTQDQEQANDQPVKVRRQRRKKD